MLLALFCAACGEEAKTPSEAVDPTADMEPITIIVEPEEEESEVKEETADTEVVIEDTGDVEGNVDGMGGSGAFDIDTPCEICGGGPSQMFTSYTDGMPEEPAFYCEACTLICYFCGDEATTHYNKPLWGEIFTCQPCYDSVHGE